MSFFSHMAARGELRVPVRVTEGFSAYTSLPFYLATGSRATMSMKMW
jgi:hypothetical protein